MCETLINWARKTHGVWLAAGLFLCGSFSARAELVWAATEASAELRPDRESLELSYGFKNSGTSDVKVTEIKFSCGCTSGATDREVYKPGEDGVLKVTFQAQGVAGFQERSITVATDETPQKPYQLILKVNVVQGVTLAPRLLIWAVNEPPSSKFASLTLAPEVLGGRREVKSSSPDFTARLVESGEVGQAKVEITPASTAAPLRAVVTLSVKRENMPDLVNTIYVRVR